MTYPIAMDVGAGSVHGNLTVPADAAGLVVFAHGSGSSRHSPRNSAVARTLQDNRLATLLFDLLTGSEEDAEAAGARQRFDVSMLSGRLLRAMDEVGAHEATRGLPLGLFGASTGAAAALAAAASRQDQVCAVVSRGGRPDLAGAALSEVTCPTLLVVGERDQEVLALNEDAAARLAGQHEVRTVTGATHLFEEPGALEQVAELAADWFVTYLRETAEGEHTTAQPGNAG